MLSFWAIKRNKIRVNHRSICFCAGTMNNSMYSGLGASQVLTNQNQVERVQKVFERINSIQSGIEGEKQSRFSIVSQLIQAFEQGLAELGARKEEKFETLAERLKHLEDFIVESSTRAESQDDASHRELLRLEKDGKRILESNSKERVESEKKLAGRIATSLEQLSLEINKEAHAQMNSHGYLDTYLLEDLPRLKDELAYEIQQRHEVEKRVRDEFADRINDLKEAYDRERKDREIKEEQLVALLKEISHRTQDNIVKVKRERERNEEQLVSLVENVIEKLKREMVELQL